MDMNVWPWVGFTVFVLAMLALDLGVFHRKAHEVKFKEALTWTGVWIVLALIFNAGLYVFEGPELGVQFLTGYLIEKALSVDNIFVMIVIFQSLRIPALYQHRVLFWGILGALVMRAIFIVAGIALLEAFHWMIYVFGALLIFTGIRMAFPEKEEIEFEKKLVVRVLKRVIPLTPNLHGAHFLATEHGKRVATPLLVALLMVETTDLIFAVDSIPAILAVSRDPFIVYTSNVFAILGLRSLYFAFAGLVNLFHYIKYALCLILLFVGVKMILAGADIYKVPTAVSLGVIGGLLAISIVLSILFPKQEESAKENANITPKS